MQHVSQAIAQLIARPVRREATEGWDVRNPDDRTDDETDEILAFAKDMSQTVVPKPNPDMIRRAEQSVGRLYGCLTRHLRHTGSETAVFPNLDLTIDAYADDQGNEFWIDPENGTVLQMGPESGRYSPSHSTGEEDSLTVHELRELAIGIIERQIPTFGLLLPVFHPLEANDRRRIYFFRWEDLSEPLPESELPPFVQVGLYADGRLASFADTLSGTHGCLPGYREPILDLPTSWTKDKTGGRA
ncbi:hypothetical protein COY93_03000 [Candidatus Uhrbacteria bacterium CG_4_10_14_0_8_um_filter_58_22]|uniref:Uncharacterized protein n=1 Tax=Candidatus Uhrbacteria bacterium CG_4_10_14_0_8_um_filter_58_22 TaxID=1975029 RepID=A0A2M7QAH5_9BACT|nr:MAG: hypothetical protein AUJ19_02880 [Parcubacteria group bacterium CG1_02_58_44]PIY62464.1 MAG: hypothetical protein COY93_03000 [Candidatus Uhrbacteria bacterium CG_4_10_14_0_8_um_filter_58_22]